MVGVQRMLRFYGICRNIKTTPCIDGILFFFVGPNKLSELLRSQNPAPGLEPSSSLKFVGTTTFVVSLSSILIKRILNFRAQ